VTTSLGRAGVLMLAGVLLLAIAAGLVLWDLTGEDRSGDRSDDPVTITGDPESP
jgi:hypothetical protein